MKLTLYMIKTCDTCRKALKALRGAGHEVTTVDLREQGIPEQKLAELLAQVGVATLLNTRSTTWRGLSEADRTEAPLILMKNHPTLIKRPVIENDGHVFVGWTTENQQKLLT